MEKIYSIWWATIKTKCKINLGLKHKTQAKPYYCKHKEGWKCSQILDCHQCCVHKIISMTIRLCECSCALPEVRIYCRQLNDLFLPHQHCWLGRTPPQQHDPWAVLVVYEITWAQTKRCIVQIGWLHCRSDALDDSLVCCCAFKWIFQHYWVNQRSQDFVTLLTTP